jgi:ribosomal protein S6--L-glutamate ligase
MTHSKQTLTIINPIPTSRVGNAFYNEAIRQGYDAHYATINDAQLADIVRRSDKVIYRVGPQTYIQFLALLDELDGNSRSSLENVLRAFNKIDTYKVLSSAAVAIPKTWLIRRGDVQESMFPFILKISNGNQGRGISLIKSQSDLDNFFKEYADQDTFVAQEFIAEAASQDKRLFVVGQKVIASMKRQSTTDDFRANIHLGGEARAYKPTAEEIEIALEAIRAFGLEYGGVDIIDSKAGPLVLEVNPAPGITIGAITGVDIAKEVVTYIMGGLDD